jgi:hypothetical protein
MNCRDHQHDIVLLLYDELSEPARNDLHIHMDKCDPCRQFFENEKRLHSILANDFSDWDMPADLLVTCRRELANELDRLDEKHAWWRIPMPSLLFRVRLLESAALVSIGLAVGVYVTNQRTAPSAPGPTDSQLTSVVPQDAAVSNLRIIGANPVSGEVELAGEVVSPMRLEGRLEDENVQRLLVGALRAPTNPGIRLRAVELLSRNSRDPSVKEALVGTLLNDENAGVRLYALQGLEPFAQEEDVRQALIYVLQTDENPGVRVQAIEALAPLTEEEAMEEVVQEAIREEPNAYIEMKALEFVGAGNR